MTSILQTLIFGLLLGGVYALFASGLTLVFGVMRIVNLAHSVFIFMAAFITYELNQRTGIDPILAITITMPIMFLFGMALYRLVLARDAESPKYTEMTVLITFSLALMTEGLLAFIFTGTNRTVRPSYMTERFYLGEILIPAKQLYASLTGFALISALWAFLRFTRIGYAIRATMQNRDAAKTVGVNVTQVSMIAFGIGMALAGASGSLYSFLFSFYPAGHWEYIGLLLSLIVLGGMGELYGAVAGALILSVAASFVSRQYGATWQPLTFYAALFIILIIRPHGLFGKKFEAR